MSNERTCGINGKECYDYDGGQQGEAHEYEEVEYRGHVIRGDLYGSKLDAVKSTIDQYLVLMESFYGYPAWVRRRYEDS